MKSFIIRFAASFIFLVVIVSWYMIPDSFFVNYSDASQKIVLEKDDNKKVEKKNSKKLKESDVDDETEMNQGDDEIKKTEEISESIKNSVKHRVPFVVQAPHAQWDEEEYQDACEEASMIMADAWINNQWHISKNDTEKQMEDMFEKEKAKYNGAIDTSIEDTSKFFNEYFGHDSVVAKNISMDDMYKVLAAGNIIIAPTNGKWLDNPNFTNGGPDRHMLVIVGYDKKNGEFVTNDPGTRVGRGYKYKDSVLFNAIRDYKTGKKEAIEGMNKDVMIVKK
ncbi:MAG: C39 family peptidase [Candidatus Moraniibacteriota bacterium]